MQQANIRWISRTALLLAIALVFQMGGFPQLVTGPLVNTVLYVAAMIVGWQGGILIGIFTPVIASLRGILPPPLTPLIPFIALGNALLVFLFFWLKNKNRIIGIIVASMVKFLLLTNAVKFLVQVPPSIANMMSFPQLVNALIGGIIALLIMQVLKKANIEID